MKHVISLAVLLWVLPPALAQLRIIEAGTSGRLGPTLHDGLEFCPSQFSTEGFSVLCDTPGGVAALFYVNGEYVGRDNYARFLIWNNNLDAINAYPASYGPTTFKCVKVNSEDKEVASTSAQIVVKCPSGEAPTPTPPATPVSTTDPMKANCVLIPALSYVGSKPDDWVVRDDALAFRPWDNSHAIKQAWYAPVKYEFTVPKASIYGLTVDMETAHGVDFNDIWITFNSITLRGPSLRTGITAPTKAYHNANGRAREAFSVDFNRHSFSTSFLEPGTKYSITIGGRSNRVAVYSILLFPCKEATCGPWHHSWKKYIDIC